MGKLPKMLERSGIVSTGGRLGTVEVPDVNLVSANFYHPTGAIPEHTLISRSVVSILSAISRILGLCAGTKILFPVIERIAIPVVGMEALVISQFPVHVNKATALTATYGIKAVSTLQGTPIVTAERLIVLGINHDVESTSKWNIFDRLVQRLDNRVSFHSVFHEEPRIPFVMVRPFSILQEAS